MLDVRAVFADSDHYRLVVVRRTQRDRVHLPGVDLPESLADQVLEPAGTRDAAGLTRVRAEVEPGEPVDRRCRPGRDVVEIIFHRGGEAVVDQPAEVLFQQADHGERDETGDQRAALLPHVTAVLDCPDD